MKLVLKEVTIMALKMGTCDASPVNSMLWPGLLDHNSLTLVIALGECTEIKVKQHQRIAWRLFLSGNITRKSLKKSHRFSKLTALSIHPKVHRASPGQEFVEHERSRRFPEGIHLCRCNLQRSPEIRGLFVFHGFPMDPVFTNSPGSPDLTKSV